MLDKLHAVIVLASVVFFLWFALPFFISRIFNIGNLTGMGLSVLLFFYGLCHERIHLLFDGAMRRGGGRAALGAFAVVLAGVCIVVVAETIGMVRAASNEPPENTNAVVLGCSVRGTRPSRILAERLEAAHAYLIENPGAVCVLSGGQGPGEDISEAECMYRYLTDRGIAAERLWMEAESTTTEENLKFSAQLLEASGIAGDITIVTSEFHGYRARRVAENLGMTSYSTPSRTFLLYLPTYYVRELYGILYYELRREEN